VLARSRAFMKVKMAVFNRRHLDLCVLIDHLGDNITTKNTSAIGTVRPPSAILISAFMVPAPVGAMDPPPCASVMRREGNFCMLPRFVVVRNIAVSPT
jgi:hypothetical protein